MKQNCIKTVAISLLVTLSLSTNASTRKVNVARSVMVGNGIAKFVPDECKFDKLRILSVTDLVGDAIKMTELNESIDSLFTVRDSYTEIK